MTFTPHRRWTLSREALERLLRRIGPDREAAAREYDALRMRLVDFFEARQAPSSEALADEAMDRVARKLEEGATIQNLRAYLYGVARLVWLEAEKHRAQERGALRELRALHDRQPTEVLEARVQCLERCLRALPEESRKLIVAYYEGAGSSHFDRRKLLAAQLGISYTTLKTRAHRIRARLEECLRAGHDP
jgi:DNA-directed RNA polymerase specialized sigma24 family protein